MSGKGMRYGGVAPPAFVGELRLVDEPRGLVGKVGGEVAEFEYAERDDDGPQGDAERAIGRQRLDP
jgi:hypothetical protein